MRALPLLALLPILAACSSEPEAPAIVPERDPATVQALNHQIMVDPDLAGLNEANAALTGHFDHSLPPVVNTRDAIEDAKLEAADLVGGSIQLVPLDPPKSEGEALPESARFAVTALAEAVVEVGDCAQRASYTARWAADMPEAFPIYPRGNVIEAAGSDSGPCALRAIRYLTPVPREDVFAFYGRLARISGLPADYAVAGDFERLDGSKGGRSYSVVVRQRSSGISEVGLVTNGF